MSSDDDLRERLDELEATVRGLTQELVEANERIRELEERLDDDAANKPMADGDDEPTGDDTDDAEGTADEEIGDDIIVA